MSLQDTASTLLAAAAVLAAGTPVSGGDVLHVDDDARPGGDGTSWSMAYRFLQDALAQAADGGVSEIRVGEGTYLPDQTTEVPTGTADRSATFALVDGVTLLGGFRGLSAEGGEDPDENDPLLHPSVLSGAIGLPVHFGDNSYHVVTASGITTPTTLDGFVVTLGNASSGTFPDGQGAGIHVGASTSLTISRCTFQLNESVVAGGGVSIHASDANVSDCTFVSCASEVGGGLAVEAGSAVDVTSCIFFACATISNGEGAGVSCRDSAGTFSGCAFAENISETMGGGLILRQTDALVIDCGFFDNHANLTAAGGGGGLAALYSSPIVIECTFSGNQAQQAAGMIHWTSHGIVAGCLFRENIANVAGGLGCGFDSSPTIYECDFVQNVAVAIGGGGLHVQCLESRPKVISCRFLGNSSDTRGGAVRNFNANPSFANCLFAGNDAPEGAAISSSNSTAGFANCTWAENLAGTGGGLHSTNASSIDIRNSILWGNTGGSIVTQIESETTVSYSNVEGGHPGDGNIDADPMFVAEDDYRLATGSPCIDAGHNWAVPLDVTDIDDDGIISELLPLDLDGLPRFNADEADFDPGCGVPVVVDMGAFEHQLDPVDEVLFADVNGDGAVNATDLIQVIIDWGECGGCCLSDLDLDGVVGVAELVAVVVNWS